MALTPAGKGIIVAVLIGAIGYGVVHYRSTIQPALVNQSDSTSVLTDSVLLDSTSKIVTPSIEVKSESTITNANQLDRTQVITPAIIETTKPVVKKAKHSVKHTENQTKVESTSNNVIPNF